MVMELEIGESDAGTTILIWDYLYFGLIPGKTALHKTVGKFFADKINAVTLQGVGVSDDEANEDTQNKNRTL